VDSSSIQLNGTEVEKVEVEGGTVKILFSRAIIIKSMTGSVEKTKWWQSGYLIFENAEIVEQATLPAVCAGGDISENVFTYRDMIPVPLESRGHASCDLYFENSSEHLKVEASSVKLDMLEVPKYIEHIRPG